MRLIAIVLVAFAALFTSTTAGNSHDSNDGCYAVCEAVKGALKDAMKISAIGCPGLTGNVCKDACYCDRVGKNGEGKMRCDNKKVPGCSVDAVTKTCQAGLNKMWHCWCQGSWNDWTGGCAS